MALALATSRAPIDASGAPQTVEPQRGRVTYRCIDCANTWQRNAKTYMCNRCWVRRQLKAAASLGYI